MEDQEKIEIVIDEPEVVEEVEFDIEGLSDQEIEMAKSHGLVKEKTDEHKEQPKVDTKDDSVVEVGEEEKEVEEKSVETPSFEDVEAKEDLISKYSPNEKALYWKWKSDKKKRQEAIKERDELKATVELSQLKDNVSSKKLDRVRELLKNTENLTIEALQAIVEGEENKASDAPLTRADLEEIEKVRAEKATQQSQEQKRYMERVATAEQIGKSKYENFDDIAKLAQETVASDKTGTYQKILSEVFIDSEIDEEQIVERVVTIAQLNPKFKEMVNKASDSDKEKVGRAIENSKKKKSSASIGSSGKRVITNESDLEPQDAAKMTTEQWMKLKESTRRRLLGG